LEGYLGGQAGAGAIADILIGNINPSGKLAETFPYKLEDNSSHANFPGGPAVVEYRESIYVGYRFFDIVKQDVLFPFGHGLSYTTFEYRDLNVKPGASESATVTLKVKNTGRVAGKEVVQIYVRDVESTAFRPEKELKGFAKVDLKPGEETDVTIQLDRRSFSFYDVNRRDWIVESGDFEILAGSSSRDIRLTSTLRVVSSQGAVCSADREKLSVYYNFPKNAAVSQKDFETLLGHPVPPNNPPQAGKYTLNTPIGEMTGSVIGRQLHGMMKSQIGKMIQGKEDTPMALLMDVMVKEMPLRGMLMMGGPLNRARLEALLLMINGRFFKGLAAFMRAGK
jgi:beta-glucosidase